jgi:Fic family protein
MMTFRGGRLQQLKLPTATIWLVTEIAEAKGRQDAYSRQPRQLLTALRETALVQSVESSNRIEGVTVAPERLRPLVMGKARPRDRSEEEVRGYRRALRRIESDAAKLTVTPALIRELHGTIQESAADAGQWKQRPNEIIEFRANMAPIIRFRPVSVTETPAAMDELCLA